MYLHPSHFNGLWGQKAPLRDGCDELWDQDARDLLAWTMAQAEELITNELGSYPAPTFVTDEEIAMALTGVRFDWKRAELRTN